MTTAAADSHPPVITVCKQKLHGGRGCWQAYELGHDGDGRWLYTPAGSTFRSSDGTSDDRCEVEGGGEPGLDSLILIPDAAQHWLATWRSPERALHINIEVCGWLRRDDLVTFLDWELDPFRLRAGLVAVEDVDDFVDPRDQGLLDQESAERALAAAAWTERALKNQAAPFDGRGDQKLAAAGSRGLPPLVDVPHPFDL